MASWCSEPDLNRGSKDEDRGKWTGRKDEGSGCQEGTGMGTNSPEQGMNNNLLAEAKENCWKLR